MDKTQQRIKIAEACGYTEVKPIYSTYKFERGDATEPKLIGIMGKFPDPTNCQPWLPDYLNDLNAMHSAWKEYFGFYSEEWLHAHSHLKQVVSCFLGEDDMEDPYVASAIANATAEQRAEAFLRTLKLWED